MSNDNSNGAQMDLWRWRHPDGTVSWSYSSAAEANAAFSEADGNCLERSFDGGATWLVFENEDEPSEVARVSVRQPYGPTMMELRQQWPVAVFVWETWGDYLGALPYLLFHKVTPIFVPRNFSHPLRPGSERMVRSETPPFVALYGDGETHRWDRGQCLVIDQHDTIQVLSPDDVEKRYVPQQSPDVFKMPGPVQLINTDH